MKTCELVEKIDEAAKKGNKKDLCKHQVQLAFKLSETGVGDSVSSLIDSKNGELVDLRYIVEKMSNLDLNISVEIMISAMQCWLKDENSETVKAVVEAAYMAYVK